VFDIGIEFEFDHLAVTINSVELKEVIQRLNKYRKIIAVLGVVGVLVAGGYLYLRPKPIYEATTLLFVTRTAQEPSKDYYTYDGFHAQQAAFHYTDTLVGLARELGADIVQRKSEQLVEVGLKGKDVSEAKRDELLVKIGDTFGMLTRAGDPEVKLLEVEGFRKMEEVKPETFLVLLTGALGGFGVGIFAAALKEYLS